MLDIVAQAAVIHKQDKAKEALGIIERGTKNRHFMKVWEKKVIEILKEISK